MITENPPGEGYLKFLYHNPFGKLALHLLVKRKIVSEIYGRMMNASNSVKKIPEFVQELNIDMNEALKSVNEYQSFNDFFFRKLKPEARPIAEGLVSPADAKLIAFESIDEVNTFFVKGQKFTLGSFLRDEELAHKYKHSSMFIFRLAPNDYHRYHFPFEGFASQSTHLAGSYFSVSPYAIENIFSTIFYENKKSLLTLSTEDKGDILLIPVGATMVGSIFETYTPNTLVKKGEEMGYFAFGGSTIVMLIDKDKVVIDQDILNNTRKKIETAVKMGEHIGD